MSRRKKGRHYLVKRKAFQLLVIKLICNSLGKVERTLFSHSVIVHNFCELTGLKVMVKEQLLPGRTSLSSGVI